MDDYDRMKINTLLDNLAFWMDCRLPGTSMTKFSFSSSEKPSHRMEMKAHLTESGA